MRKSLFPMLAVASMGLFLSFPGTTLASPENPQEEPPTFCGIVAKASSFGEFSTMKLPQLLLLDDSRQDSPVTPYDDRFLLLGQDAFEVTMMAQVYFEEPWERHFGEDLTPRNHRICIRGPQ